MLNLRRILVNLRSSLRILLEGGIIVIVAFFGLIIFGCIGVARWTIDRLIDAWANKQ